MDIEGPRHQGERARRARRPRLRGLELRLQRERADPRRAAQGRHRHVPAHRVLPQRPHRHLARHHAAARRALHRSGQPREDLRRRGAGHEADQGVQGEGRGRAREGPREAALGLPLRQRPGPALHLGQVRGARADHQRGRGRQHPARPQGLVDDGRLGDGREAEPGRHRRQRLRGDEREEEAGLPAVVPAAAERVRDQEQARVRAGLRGPGGEPAQPLGDRAARRVPAGGRRRGVRGAGDVRPGAGVPGRAGGGSPVRLPSPASRCQDDLAAHRARLREAHRLGGPREREGPGDAGGDLAACERGEDRREVGAQVGAEACLVPRAGPDVVETGAAAVGQHLPQTEAREELDHRPVPRARVVPRRRGPVRDERAAAREQPPGVDDPGPSDVVEDGRDTLGRQLPHPRGHFAVVVVDRRDAERAQRLVVAGRRGADDLDARGACELDEDGADAAARAVHEDGLPGAHLGLAVEHLPGGDAVDDDGLGLLGAHALGHRYEVGGGDPYAARPAAHLEQRGHPPPHEPRVDARPRLVDAAHDVVPRHEGERRLVEVPAAPHLLLGEGDPARLHREHHLALAGHGRLRLPYLEALRLHDARQDDLDKTCALTHDAPRSIDALAFVRSCNSSLA
ncbi:putative dehydrogenase [Streptomyces sp. Tu6071]|nr:putative dehydrogenase [Streptomyces sp. Tu6071]